MKKLILNRKTTYLSSFIFVLLFFMFIVFMNLKYIEELEDSISELTLEHYYFKSSIEKTLDSLYDKQKILKMSLSESSQKHNIISKGASIIKRYRPSMTEYERVRLASVIYNEVEKSDLEYSFVLAIITQESRFSYKALSDVGAKGIMQIMPLTFVSVAKAHNYDYDESDLYDYRKNIKIGVLFLNKLKKKYKKNEYVSAGYNGGERGAIRYKMYDVGEDVDVIEETYNFVDCVMGFYKEYKVFLGE